MQKKVLVMMTAALLSIASCKQNSVSVLPESALADIVAVATESLPSSDAALLEKGIRQAAALWTAQDGTEADFRELVGSHLASDSDAKLRLFKRLERMMEVFNQSYDLLSVELLKPTTLTGHEPEEVDYILSGYGVSSHFSDDMFANKIAFITILNFPHFTLAEKNELGAEWSRQEWAYARMGDVFTDRVPAEVLSDMSETSAAAENYIASYNIMMGHLLTEDGRRLFPEDMCLLSHWNLRDELKSNYADIPNANEKQEMIYKVMERIVTQDIPAAVVNNAEYDWAPYSNRTWREGAEISLDAENSGRYQKILDIFHTYLEADAYYPSMPTAIQRNFEGSLEISDEQIEQLFVRFLSSPQVAKVAGIIRDRLGRNLRPYDIWYDGFKSRSSMPEDVLTAQTRKLYPDADAFHADMPRQLMNIGFSAETAKFLADRIVVEGAVGSGHAWNCTGHEEPARLRTRIGADGMDYKGYNIAVHEFGHNVEMVLDLYKNDQYMLYGVPDNAFTEAMAFMFQVRDLQLLGHGRHAVDANTTLDQFWGMYEIMGVSLVDMYTWRWLYEHQDATAEDLRDAVLSIAKEVWNSYYEPVLGEHDSVVLGIYSHMVDVPMYLPSYPLGHIIHYQLEEHLKSCSTPAAFAKELERIYVQGRLTPNAWMQGAVGEPLSIDPVLKAIDALN